MNWYLDVLKNKYAMFNGRARRKEYWFFVLFNILASIALGIVDTITGTFNDEMGVGLLGGIYWLAVLIPAIAVAVRRLHDTGRRGWWLLLPVPFVTVGYTVAPDLFEQVVAGDAASFRLFVLLFFNNLIYMVMLAVVVIFLALPGRPDANRFGPPPAD